MQGVIYDNKLVVKPGPVPEFYQIHKGKSIIPDDVTEFQTDCHAYGYVSGRQAWLEDAPNIVGAMACFAWLPGSYECFNDKNLEAYITYINDQCFEPIVESQYRAWHDDSIAKDVWHWARGVLRSSYVHMPAVISVHGDLTFENVIVETNGSQKLITLIDPGKPWCRTPAFDRGKLLQSAVLRWEQRTRIDEGNGLGPWAEPYPIPYWANAIDVAFLVTHWIRLVRYWPNYLTVSAFPAIKRLVGI